MCRNFLSAMAVRALMAALTLETGGGCVQGRSALGETSVQDGAPAPFTLNTPGLAETSDRSPKARRRASMQSVYFFAYNESAEELRPEDRPIPLLEAASILSADRDPGFADRRLRAAVVLAASGFSPDKNRAMHILARGEPQLLSNLPGELPPESDEERNRREAHLYLRIVGAPGAGISCARSSVTTQFGVGANGEVESVTITLLVSRSVSELRAALDPQNWQHCGTFFDRSEIVVEIDGEYYPDTNAPSPGSTYSNRLLFEEFVFEYVAKWIVLRNILHVSSHGPPDVEHHVKYLLAKSLETEFPWRKQPGGLDLDEGFITARPIEGFGYQTELTVRKELRFGGFFTAGFLNFWRKPMFRLLAEEVREAVCCDMES